MSLPRLRVGLVTDGSMRLPGWLAGMLASASFRQHAELALVTLPPASTTTTTPSSPAADGSRLDPDRVLDVGIVGLYARLDGARGGGADDALALVDASGILAEASRWPPGDDARPDVVQAVGAESRMDIILDIDGRAPTHLAAAARLGVWSVRVGGGPLDRRAALREVLMARPLVELSLTARQADGRVLELERGTLRTEPVSAHATRMDLARQAACLITKALRGAASTTPEPGPAAPDQRFDASLGGGGAVRMPSTADVVRLAGRYARRQLVSRTMFEQWFLAYTFQERSDPLALWEHLPREALRVLLPPTDRFWADPFVVKHEGRFFLFFEELVYRHGRGWIAVLELGPEGPVAGPARVLDAECHLSYPQIFMHEGSYFMIPETAGRRRVELYRATAFPTDWVLEAILVEGESLVDATVAEIEGRWWMFAGHARDAQHVENELHIYHASSLRGPWAPHRRRPVLADVTCARPGGALFQHAGAWYRPAQDGSRGYGGGLRLQRIGRLDPDGYEEATVRRLDPDWAPGLVGTHTWNQSDGLLVVDGRRRRWKPLSRWGPSRP